MTRDPIGSYVDWVGRVAGDNSTVGVILMFLGSLALVVPVLLVVRLFDG